MLEADKVLQTALKTLVAKVKHHKLKLKPPFKVLISLPVTIRVVDADGVAAETVVHEIDPPLGAESVN
jgi:PII-like signaling protein